MAYYHSKKSPSQRAGLGGGGGGSAGWEQVAGSPCQSQLEELAEALPEVKAEIQCSSHQPTGELNWRMGGWRLLLVDVISKPAKFVLNLPEMIMNTLIVMLSVAL